MGCVPPWKSCKFFNCLGLWLGLWSVCCEPVVKTMKTVRVCGWGLGCVPLGSENCENCEIGFGLWLGCGLYISRHWNPPNRRHRSTSIQHTPILQFSPFTIESRISEPASTYLHYLHWDLHGALMSPAYTMFTIFTIFTVYTRISNLHAFQIVSLGYTNFTIFTISPNFQRVHV